MIKEGTLCIENVPRLQSWLDWRNATTKNGVPWGAYIEMVAPQPLNRHNMIIGLRKKMGLDNVNVCPLCNGDQVVKMGFTDDQDFYRENDRYCACYMLDYQAKVENRHRQIKTSFKEAALAELTTNHLSNPAAKKNLETAIATVKGWMTYPGPNSWLVLSGMVGNGKTHMARAIATWLAPMALFITAEDLGQTFYNALDDHSTGEMLKILSGAPILIIDDIVSARDYAKERLSHVINSRYIHGRNLPTVVTTNLSEKALYQWDDRMASRLLDKEFSHYLRLDLPDYRVSR